VESALSGRGCLGRGLIRARVSSASVRSDGQRDMKRILAPWAKGFEVLRVPAAQAAEY